MANALNALNIKTNLEKNANIYTLTVKGIDPPPGYLSLYFLY